ncbi:hypothetical protein [Nostoc sp. UHCC 0870]|uniref:hypothetical protein n=1 Tax=Nostoc sp. UHCC 0870 TaxID=2914041 RepID=UPI001EE05CA1|nr:hypothetical protein [Nostoc sp. UHCC 0870]UKO99975.1 hypothetical protein L6494_09840 [Nostoc sp. UHCC 0870]
MRLSRVESLKYVQYFSQFMRVQRLWKGYEYFWFTDDAYTAASLTSLSPPQNIIIKKWHRARYLGSMP